MFKTHLNFNVLSEQGRGREKNSACHLEFLLLKQNPIPSLILPSFVQPSRIVQSTKIEDWSDYATAGFVLDLRTVARFVSCLWFFFLFTDKINLNFAFSEFRFDETEAVVVAF